MNIPVSLLLSLLDHKSKGVGELQEAILITRVNYLLPACYQENVLGPTQPAITCSKLTIETLEQGIKYVQS